MIVSQMRWDPKAARKMKNFPVKPAVRGIPANERRKIDKLAARYGMRCPDTRKIFDPDIVCRPSTNDRDDCKGPDVHQRIGQQIE